MCSLMNLEICSMKTTESTDARVVDSLGIALTPNIDTFKPAAAYDVLSTISDEANRRMTRARLAKNNAARYRSATTQYLLCTIT